MPWTDAPTASLLAASLLLAGLAASPAAASHRDEQVSFQAAATAEGVVDCAVDGNAVVCEASATWEGDVACYFACKATFGDLTNATFSVAGPDGESSAVGRDTCGYNLNGCEIADDHAFEAVERTQEGCYDATLEVHTVVNATAPLREPGEQEDSEDEHLQRTDSACL